MLKNPKFNFGEKVHRKLSGEPGIVLGFSYHSPEYIIYLVGFEQTGVDSMKDYELSSEDEYETERILRND